MYPFKFSECRIYENIRKRYSFRQRNFNSMLVQDLCVLRCHLSQTSNSRSNSNGRGCGQSVRTTGNDLAARFAFPNAHICSFYIVFSAKHAAVGTVLRDFNLANQLSQCATVPSSVLSGDTDLLRALTHLELIYLNGTFQCEKQSKHTK